MAKFAPVYAELSAILKPYTDKLDVEVDQEGEIYIVTRHLQKNGKPLFFAAVQIKKRYVSYHLMPVYVQPQLLEGISPELKKRMQGKSCFNFTKVDESLFAELAELTAQGFASYQQQGFIPNA